MIHELEQAIYQVEQGQSQYICICLPPRHGKSDVVSRRLPVWSLIRNPHWEFILASYNYSLAAEMSIDARRCFREVAPMFNLNISEERNQIGSWKLADEDGALFATGIGGTVTGRGAHILAIDDYYKNREEAESQVMRDKVFESFQSDLLSRLAPVHAVLIVANRWHVDDVVGRIIRKNDPKSDDYDKDFPVFRHINFPAYDDQEGWLFQERFSEGWYKSMRSFMGTYSWQAQAMQEPTPRTGNLFDTSKVQIVELDTEEKQREWDQKPWQRGWDLASSKKERMKDDPDFTVGTKACFINGRLCVDDVVWGQWEATKRDEMLEEVAVKDGPIIPVLIETVAGYKDAFILARDLLNPKNVVVKRFNPSGKGDKVARSSCLEPAFELGRVFIKKAHWNDRFLVEQGSFPDGRHDDFTDSLVVAIYDQAHRQGSFEIH